MLREDAVGSVVFAHKTGRLGGATFRNSASPLASRSSTRQRSTTPPSHSRDRSYFVRKTGSNGFRFGYQPTIKKVVSDWRASLDEGTEVKNRLKQFRRIATRYEKTAGTYLSMLCIAATRLWIKTVNTA